MSVDKILNRPMFRKAALKKGHLKPIHAQTGVMVGAPTRDIRNTRFRPPAVVPQPGFMQRAGTFAGRLGRDIKSFPRSLPGQITSPRTRVPFGMGGGIGRFLVAPTGAYDAVSGFTTKMGMQPGMLKTGVDFGLSGLALLNPYTRAASTALGAYNLIARPLVGGAIDYVTQKPMGTTSKAMDLNRLLGEPSTLGASLFTQPTGKRLTRKQRRDLRKQEKAAEQEGSEVAILPKEADDALTVADNKTKVGNQEVVDITKVANNTGGVAPVPPETTTSKAKEDDFASGKFEPKEDDIKLVTTDSGQTGATSGEGKVTAADGTKVTDDTIARARQIRDELMAGKSSQAKLVFLANLAAGLMSGTTAKAGIGGALEVFGKALGPAVNNYATIKLKEDEISNDFMQSALELAADEIAAKNDAVEYEYPERTPGIIQEIGSGGVIRNYVGALMKDGTMLIRVPGAIDQNGRQQYIPYAGTGRFKEMDFVNDKTTEIANDIDGILRSVSTADKSLKILEEAYAQDKSFGGLVGQLRITTERVTDALGDLTTFGNRVDFGDQYELLLDKNAKALVEGGEFKDEKSAKEYLKEQLGRIDANGKAITGDGKSFVDKNLSKFLGDDRTSDAQNLERLAVNETILVYALANALKSKDRLTQKDIQNAKELVKVFSLGRGAKTTIRSLRALREILVDKYTSQERLYRLAGGDEGTLNNFKEAYKIIPGTATTEQGRVFGDLSQSDLLNQFGDLPK